jgi:hypothetical protein
MAVKLLGKKIKERKSDSLRLTTSLLYLHLEYLHRQRISVALYLPYVGKLHSVSEDASEVP